MNAISLTDHFGVASRPRPSRHLDPDELQLLRDGFDQGVVLVRQALSDGDHDRFARALGPLNTYPWATTFEYMSNINPTDGSISGTRQLLFHIDGVYG